MVKSLACVTLFVGIVAGCSSDPDTLSGSPLPKGSSEVADDANATTPAPSATAAPPPAKSDAGADAAVSPVAPPSGAQDLCVSEINKWRATEGLPPLKRWTEAEVCTDGQCKSDSETGRAHGAFGRCGENAQNECPGWNGKPETMIEGCLKMMWDEKFGSGEKGHYENMKNTRFTRVSCGFFVTPNGKTWAIQNFRP